MVVEKGYIYTDFLGDDYTVFPKLNFYLQDNNIYLGFDYMDPEEGFRDPYCDATVNVEKMPYLHAAIDTNNNGNKMIDFLVNNGFGAPTGQYVHSGFCMYPVFCFNAEKMKEIDPEVFKAYQIAHGMEYHSVDEQIKAAGDEIVNRSSEVGQRIQREEPEL